MTIDFSALPTDFQFPVPHLPKPVQQDITNILWEQLLVGNLEITDYFDIIDDVIEDAEISEEDALLIIKSLFETRKAQLLQWKAAGVLPPDRVTAAFAELQAQRILALSNFTCCGTCGAGEAYERMEAEKDLWEGYIFFHTQDTEALIEDGETYLSYGVNWFSQSEDPAYNSLPEAEQEKLYVQACQKMADEILEPTFQKHGITFTWDGDYSTRMHIEVGDYVFDLSELNFADLCAEEED